MSALTTTTMTDGRRDLVLLVTAGDQVEFGRLSARWRDAVGMRLAVLREWQRGHISKEVGMRRLNISRATWDRYVAAVREHGWRGLVPGYSQEHHGLPSEFVEWFKSLACRYQRKTAPAMRELLRIWRAKGDIPGYAGHPGWPEVPRGWTKRNLYRYAPTKFELSTMRHGLGRATAKYAPKVMSTRVGLWHLSHVLWDDVWLDMKCHLLTSRKPVRPMQIGAVDLLSGCRFTYGMRPELWRADGTRERLGEADMRFALASMLYHYGVSARGTTMVIEHGTATVRQEVRMILERYLGDLITWDESGMIGKVQALSGFYDNRGGGGNPRHKAALESLHNLMHNELAALPGQTGHDRDEPEFLGVMEREHETLWRLAEKAGPEVMGLLKSPFLEYHTQLVPAVAGILKAMNERDDHDLEGWAKLGYLKREYRLHAGSSEWLNEGMLLGMGQEVRGALVAMAGADPRCLRVSKLSPAEVFDLNKQDEDSIVRVPVAAIAEILYADLAKERKVARGYIEFEDVSLAPEKLSFESRVMGADGREVELMDGEIYDVTVNPFDQRVAWVYSGTRQKGAFLGCARAVQRHCRADVESAKRAFGRAKERMADLLEPVRRRGVKATQEVTERFNHNAAVIEGVRDKRAAFAAKATEILEATVGTVVPVNEEVDW